MCENGDSSHILKPFECSLNWKPHFNSAHTAAIFLLYIKNKRGEIDNAVNFTHTCQPLRLASSVIETSQDQVRPVYVAIATRVTDA